MTLRSSAARATTTLALLAAAAAGHACTPASTSASGSGGGTSGDPEHSTATHSSTFASSGNSGAGSNDTDGGAANSAATSTAQQGETQPAAPAFPPPPTWSEVQTRLRSGGQAARCFQNNVIRANLAEAYADADFNGDGRPERIWQLPDCLLVVAQGAEHWEFPAMIQRRIPPHVDSVRLVAVRREGATLLEVRDTRDEPRSRDTYRFRWTGTELQPVP